MSSRSWASLTRSSPRTRWTVAGFLSTPKQMRSPSLAPSCDTSSPAIGSTNLAMPVLTAPPSTLVTGSPPAPNCLTHSARASVLAGHFRPAGHDDGLDASAGVDRALEDLEVGLLRQLGDVLQFHGEAEVGPVAAEALHRLGVGHPLDLGDVDVEHLLPHPPDQPFVGRHHVVLLDEGHLHVELGELGLPVGAGVLVAEAADDLHVLLAARGHEDLLEELRALRQGVEAAGVQPARARGSPARPRASIGRGRASRSRGSPPRRGSRRIVCITRCRVRRICCIRGRRRSRKRYLQPVLLAGLARVLGGEGRGLGLAQDLALPRVDLDLARGEAGVGPALALDALALDGDDVLVPELGGQLVGLPAGVPGALWKTTCVSPSRSRRSMKITPPWSR